MGSSSLEEIGTLPTKKTNRIIEFISYGIETAPLKFDRMALHKFDY